MGAVLLDHRVNDLLQLADGINALLSNRIFFHRIALGHLPERMGRYVRRFQHKEELHR